jgi:hypothetical protein
MLSDNQRPGLLQPLLHLVTEGHKLYYFWVAQCFHTDESFKKNRADNVLNAYKKKRDMSAIHLKKFL